MLLDRRSAPFLAVGVALVLLAGGLVAVGVWWATNCFGGGWDGRWARTCPPPPRGRTGPTSPRRATCATSASTPRCAGVSGSTSTASASRPSRSTAIRSSARRPWRTGSWSPRSAVPAASRPSRRTRRSSRRTTRRRGRRAGRVEGPRARGELRLLAVGGRLLLVAERLTALDVASGAFAWCVDAAGAVVAAEAQRVVLAVQDGRNSSPGAASATVFAPG